MKRWPSLAVSSTTTTSRNMTSTRLFRTWRYRQECVPLDDGSHQESCEREGAKPAGGGAFSRHAARELGDGKAIADTIIAWIDAGAADGFILGFSVVAEGLDDFVRYVLPELEKRGRYSCTLPGRTLRDHLGLIRKESRYAAKAVISLEKDRA